MNRKIHHVLASEGAEGIDPAGMLEQSYRYVIVEIAARKPAAMKGK